jgi:hypothetical protein
VRPGQEQVEKFEGGTPDVLRLLDVATQKSESIEAVQMSFPKGKIEALDLKA